MVFEAAIDAMSYADMFPGHEKSLVALGMLWDAPLATFLSEHPQVQCITFCLDNDAPGRKASESLMEKYYGMGFDVGEKRPPEQYKDYNEWLKAVRKPVSVIRRTEREGSTVGVSSGTKAGKTQSAGRCR